MCCCRAKAMRSTRSGCSGSTAGAADGAPATDKKILQGEDLPSVPQRALREQTHFGQRVEDDAFRIYRRNPDEDVLGGLAESQLRRMKQRQLLVRIETRFRRHQLEN